MADRDFPLLKSQGRAHVKLTFSVKWATGAPQFVEGDTAGAIAGAYVKLTQTGAGVLTITTIDKWLAMVATISTISMAVPAGAWVAIGGIPTQDATLRTWSVSINTFSGAVATTPANGDMVNVELTLRNSTVLP